MRVPGPDRRPQWDDHAHREAGFDARPPAPEQALDKLAALVEKR
jgi:hypothetical protein